MVVVDRHREPEHVQRHEDVERATDPPGRCEEVEEGRDEEDDQQRVVGRELQPGEAKFDRHDQGDQEEDEQGSRGDPEERVSGRCGRSPPPGVEAPPLRPAALGRPRIAHGGS